MNNYFYFVYNKTIRFILVESLIILVLFGTNIISIMIKFGLDLQVRFSLNKDDNICFSSYFDIVYGFKNRYYCLD